MFIHNYNEAWKKIFPLNQKNTPVTEIHFGPSAIGSHYAVILSSWLLMRCDNDDRTIHNLHLSRRVFTRSYMHYERVACTSLFSHPRAERGATFGDEPINNASLRVLWFEKYVMLEMECF